MGEVQHDEVQISVDGVTLEAELTMPRSPTGIVLFAHGSGSGRHSPRNQFVAWKLQCAGLGTLLLDLLTRQEELDDTPDGHLRFNVRMLARRLTAATVWSATHHLTRNLSVGYFGASTGAAAALVAASRLGSAIAAVVSRGGRPDLASAELPHVVTPTLLIVGGHDKAVLELNRTAYAQLSGEKQLEIVPNATHLFEEPGAINAVAALASDWFRRYLVPNCAPTNSPVA
jgi:putative phosphoribosyl transferase